MAGEPTEGAMNDEKVLAALEEFHEAQRKLKEAVAEYNARAEVFAAAMGESIEENQRPKLPEDLEIKNSALRERLRDLKSTQGGYSNRHSGSEL